MKRTRSWILAGLVVTMPSFVRADAVDVPAYTAVPPCAEMSGEPVIGTVVAMNGPVSIGSPGCAPAAADCGTALHAGQHLITGGGASVGLLAGSHYVQVAEGSRVAVATTDAGATRVAVEEGSARVIDVGAEPGPALEITTPTLVSANPGADVVAAAPAQGPASICSYADPIQVRQGDAVTAVPAGSCIGAASGPSAPPVVTPVPTGLVALTSGPTVPPLSIAGVARCDVAAGDPGLSNVASGPVAALLPPNPAPVPPPVYCVGGSCSPPPPPPPPPTSCCPGGIAEQPVIFEPPPD